MASTWETHLGLTEVSEGKWSIGTYCYNWIPGSFDEEGEIIIPDELDGHRVRGVADGEYIETDELINRGHTLFNSKTLKAAKDFCEAHGWSKVTGFDRAFLRVVSAVKPDQPLSKYIEFKGKPLLRTGYSTNPSYSGESELGIFDSDAVTEVWAWDSENGSEYIFSLSGKADLNLVTRAVAQSEMFASPVDWESLEIKGMSRTEGVVLALAWDGDQASKVAARLLLLWPQELITKIFGEDGLAPEDLIRIGDQVFEMANELEVDIDDIKQLPTPIDFDEKSLRKTMAEAIRRFATNQRRRESRQEKRIEPFSKKIESIVTAYLKGKPKGFYPGMGYVVPPVGGASLRQYLIAYAKKNKKLPTGTVSVPHDLHEFRGRGGSFMVDLEKLTSES